jgi:hypothetical protein
MIPDKQMLSVIEPLQMTAYVRSHGWNSVKSVPEKYSRWILGNDTETEITIPASQDIADFPYRVGDVLQALSVIEKRPLLEVFQDIVLCVADVIRFRIISADASDGTISLEDGTKILARTRDLFAAAACAAVEPKRIYPSKRPAKASEYLQKIRLGQTQQGSYVFSAISNVPPMLATSGMKRLFDIADEPFERQTTITLSRALAAVQCASEQTLQTSDCSHFLKFVNEGVSVNFCESLAGLHLGVEPKHKIEIRMSWASHRPVPSDIPHLFTFRPEHLIVIGESARIFRRSQPHVDFRLTGHVKKLERNDTINTGQITVLGNVDGHWRQVTVVLETRDYDIAIEAHQKRLPVTCTGILHCESKYCELKSPSSLEICTTNSQNYEIHNE